jgi:DMSO/TMAO reductase YedYZ molybdopterin-dependent catalytic subunit
MNDKPLPPDHGAPLRLRNETQLGFKQVKWIKGLEFVADFADIDGSYGGYHQDHKFLGTDNPSDNCGKILIATSRSRRGSRERGSIMRADATQVLERRSIVRRHDLRESMTDLSAFVRTRKSAAAAQQCC